MICFCWGDLVQPERILIADDEQAVRGIVHFHLRGCGYEVAEASDCNTALRLCRESPPDLAILDHSMPDGTGVDLISQVLAIDAELPIVILTGHSSVDLAVRAMSNGASHFLTKPVEMPALVAVIKRILEGKRIRRRELAEHNRQERDAVDPFAGRSAKILELFEQAKRLAIASSPLLILGETGVGKGVLARWIHEHGPGNGGAFVDLNCAGLSRDLLESELFGHERGAFTGAVSRKLGLLEVAHRGSLFLDEIGELDLAVQGKLLKVLEDRRFRRVGDVQDRVAAVRFIAATHRSLPDLVSQQRFRSDLYFRISAIPLQMPPVRERREDIPLLAESLLQRCARDLGRDEMSLSDAALRALGKYHWPGNIRELRNVIERAVLLCDEAVIEPHQLHFQGAEPETQPAGALSTLSALECGHIQRVLQECAGRVEDAAKILGIPRSSLYQKLKTHRIVFPKSKTATS